MHVTDISFAEYRRLWDAAGRCEILPDFPLHMDLETASGCNLRCGFCFQNYMAVEHGLMDFEVFRRVVDEGVAEGLCSIKLHIRGEPTLHPRLVEFIRYAKQAGLHEVRITTNGTLLTPERIADSIDAGLDWFAFSYDPTHAMEARLQRGSRFLDPEDAIDLTMLARDARGGRPVVRIHAVVFDPRYVEPFRRRLVERFAGVDAVQVSLATNLQYDVPAHENMYEIMDFDPCDYLWRVMSVHWNGDVVPCCRDYEGRFTIANVRDTSVKAIWHGPEFTRLRALHLSQSRQQIGLCRHCDYNHRLKAGATVVPAADCSTAEARS